MEKFMSKDVCHGTQQGGKGGFFSYPFKDLSLYVPLSLDQLVLPPHVLVGVLCEKDASAPSREPPKVVSGILPVVVHGPHLSAQILSLNHLTRVLPI